jgi:hypothetical protein
MSVSEISMYHFQQKLSYESVDIFKSFYLSEKCRKRDARVNLELKLESWQLCTTLRITEFLDFIHYLIL